MTEEELRSFLDDQRIVQVCTIGPKGRPHVMPLWYVVEQGQVLRGWTYAASQKAKNLERDPHATVSIDDGVQYHELRGVMMECDVEVEHDPEAVAGYGIALFERYALRGDTADAESPLAGDGALAPDVREMVRKQAAKRVGLRFLPTRTVTWDHGKLGGTY